MWELYDHLIDSIPEGLVIEDAFISEYRSLVKAGDFYGLGSMAKKGSRQPERGGRVIGLPLREVASYIKSWNPYEAALGHAAINAWYNSPDAARAAGIVLNPRANMEDRQNDPFITCQNTIRGKKVAIMGHFPYIEQLIEPICELSIFEDTEDDNSYFADTYPYAACEYMFPEQDVIFLPSHTFSSRTLPRLLELSAGAYLILVGPTTPMTPLLFDFGIDNLSGFIIMDGKKAGDIVTGRDRVISLYSSGQKVCLRKDISSSSL